ncbi:MULTISPECIES: WXG100 family type VII secretion target [Streptomyces]|jgi:WXG100 family type VII secretion target|uniref:WXG100 family type VII secretion target n=1 Tax=Streptomyces TaxID=1883 RepID=UPI001673CD97|nr:MULTISPECIES: WXG100 family type VII secretion target [Streptomyces]MCX4564156.1 WXG100 family type VII secretion target [Streptomyces phaeochromogenes]MCR3725148.1 WXG100 family type VII secretion target [Streptomyces umbrinus]MCZ4515941.1 WXG100 family type VII secretion target [Streptomyces sp. ActVer]WSS90533.1 WXG100 family type VII secretion target [Streptomyces phaeochromogenes]WSW11728.1 WXG100 family type VII secretion target [Streptomyces phaeochromogenes]
MADGIIDVQYPKVQQAIEELMEQTQVIITTLNNLEDELKPLVSTWEGADQEQYRVVQAEWDNATKNMAKLLGDNGELIRTIHDNHSRDERKSADNWGNVRAR